MTITIVQDIQVNDVTFTTDTSSMEIKIGSGMEQYIEIVEDIDQYDGEYHVTPQPTSQTLYSKNLKMLDDVVVYGVPYSETQNEYGTTVSICS